MKEEQESFCVLLVDSEVSVQNFGKCWEHLQKSDNWKRPKGATDNQCHLMVQVMESWFISDAKAIKKVFQSAKVDQLGDTSNLEQVSKDEVMKRIAKSTNEQYDKMKHSPRLLLELDVSLVRSKSLHCERIFGELNEVIKTG